MNKILFLSLLLLAATPEVTKPDINQTQGSLCSTSDRDFKEFRYKEKVPVCVRNVSTGTKNIIYRNYRVTNTTDYIIDHLIPLSYGGSNNVDNLWPQHISVSTTKLEQDVYNQLAAGSITQQEAIKRVTTVKFRGK